MMPNLFKNLLAGLVLISAVGLTVSDAGACGWEPEYSVSRFPAFQFVDTPASGQRPDDVDAETVDFWYGYTGGNVDRQDIADFIKGATVSDVSAPRGALMEYLVSRSDASAIGFLKRSIAFSEALDRYYDCVWDYEKPSDSDLPSAIDDISIPSPSDPMYERYLFLSMRAHAAMHRYADVIDIWHRYGASVKNDRLKDRMLGYLGGAYYHTGNYVDALSIFARNGDANSLNWCLSRMVGADNLVKLLEADPDSEAVYYVLQDYMNYLWLLKLNLAEEWNFPLPGNPYRNGEYVADSDLAKECLAIIAVADRVMSDGMSAYPAVWATAKAFALNMMGRGREAGAVIKDASRMKSTGAMRANLERTALWIDFSNYDEAGGVQSKDLAERYNTLYIRASSKAGMVVRRNLYGWAFAPGEIADYAFLADFMVPYAALQYRDTPLYYRALAMMDGVKSINPEQDYCAFQPSNRWTSSLQSEGLSAMVDKLDGRSAMSDLDRAIFSGADIDVNAVHDALGRVALSMGDYEGAIGHFGRLDPYWIGRQGYYGYLQTRYDKEGTPFKRTDRGYESLDMLPLVGAVNYRADYSRKLLELRRGYEESEGEAKAEAGYDYAAALFRASAQGDLWAVSDNLWSVYHQVDPLSAMAVKVLMDISGQALPTELKARIWFGLASVRTMPDAPSYAWGGNAGSWDWKTFPAVSLEAYSELAKIYGEIRDPQIRGCDVLKSYMAR